MMNKTLNVLLIISLFQGCSMLSKQADNVDLLVDYSDQEDIISSEDSLLYIESSLDSIATDFLSIDTHTLFLSESSLVDDPIVISDVFNLIPTQKVAYGDTLKLDLLDYIYSNFIDIDLVDSKNFNVHISDNLISITPIINKNQLSSIRFNINGQVIDMVIFSYSTSYSHSDYNRNRNAIILKDSFEDIDDYLTLNYKYLSSGSYDTNLKDNTNFILLNNEILDPKFYHIFNDRIRIMLPKDFDQSILRLFSLDNYGVLLTQNETILFNNTVLYPDQDIISPYFSNMYYILIDRFYNNKEDSIHLIDLSIDRKVSFHGGDLSGVSKKVSSGYFNRLGVNNIILSPISSNSINSYRSDNPPYRKYMGFDGSWPIKSRSIDQRFGTSEELESLIVNSHQHGLGIHLNYILGHAHSEHDYYRKYADWFSDDYIQNRSFLPGLALLSQSAIKQISSDIIYWMNKFDFDGLHYSSIENIENGFWNYLNKTIYSEIDRADQVVKQETYRYNIGLYHKGREHFSGINTNFKHLNSHIKLNLRETGSINLLGTVTTINNDPKFISVADGHTDYQDIDDHDIFVNFPQKVINKSSYDKLFMFHLMNNSLPGVPITFQGDEYGQVGIGYSDSKRDIKFKKELKQTELNLKSKISRLNSVRLKYPSLSVGDFYVLKEGPDYTVWLKSYFNEHTIIFFNLQDKIITLNFPLPFESKRMISLLDDQIIQLDNPRMASIVIPPLESGILLLDRK